MGRILRRLAGALLLAALACGTASAFPDKPVTFLVPQPPGGANDALVRAIAQRLQVTWGQSVVVDFRPGGGVIVGTQALARSPADGHTLGLITSGHSLNQALRTDLPYDSVKDFAPVARIGYYGKCAGLSVHRKWCTRAFGNSCRRRRGRRRGL